MALTGVQRASLIKKALAAGTKSEGMRMLLEADFSVSETAEAFGVEYGFAYGVARRASGDAKPAGVQRREPKAKAAPAAKAKAATATKAKAKAAPAAKAKAASQRAK